MACEVYFGGKSIRDQEARQRGEQGWDQNDFQAPPQHRQIIVHRQFAIFTHTVHQSGRPEAAKKLFDTSRRGMPFHPNRADVP